MIMIQVLVQIRNFIIGYDNENKSLHLPNNIVIKISRRKLENLGAFLV